MKKLLVLSIFLLTVVFSYSVIAQEIGAMRKSLNVNFPEKIQQPLGDPLPAGTYSIGSGGYFSTIQAAFDKLSTDGVAGAVTLELIDELYTAPTDSFGFKLIGPIPGAGLTSRVIIKPAASTNVTLEGNGFRVMTFINTSYLTIDGVGLNGSTTLIFHALYNASYEWNDCLVFLDNSDHNIVKNITFSSEDIYRWGGTVWMNSGTSAVPDSNLIMNNFVKKGGAMYIAGPTGGNPRPDGNIIRGNFIGSETDSLINWGIQLSTCSNSIVENNVIQNLKIMNTVPGGEKLILGINSYSGLGDIIRNNVVHNIKSPSGYTTVGILLSGGSGFNDMVYNNMIYDIQSASTQSNSRVSGIQIWNQTNPKIYYNTVYLTGNGNGANPAGSAALYIYGGFSASTGVDLMNNIFVNNRDESPYCASAIYDYNIYNLSSDYNDLYYQTNPYNCLVRIGSTNYHTLADWQAAGKDLNSLNESVNFVSPTDLHINNNFITLLDGRATPITGITLDFDGETRNTNTPDIGADEFELIANASNWQMQNSNFPSNVLVVDFSSVNSQVCWAVGQIYPGGVTPYPGYIKTIDGGENWILSTIPGIPDGFLQQIFAIDADTAYVTVYVLSSQSSKGIYKTTDGGLNWNKQTAYNTSLYGPGYIHFFDSQNGVVIGDPNLETYTTSNGGLIWNPVTMPTPLTDELTWLGESRITAVGNTVWFSTNYRLFKSTDKGYTWTFLFNEQQYFGWLPSIAFQDNQTGIYALKIFGFGTNHIYKKTTDGGTTWSILSNSVLDNLAPSCIQHIPGTNSVYVAVGGRTPTMRGTAVTYDAGESWTLIDTVGVFLINFVNDQLGWGSQYTTNVVYKYVGPRIISSVEEEVVDLVPTGYSLSQNYPNPFNPITTFRYSIPTQSKVVIKVYDILGNEIATIMDEEKSVGTYELTWNAASLPSGIYFYQLKAGDYSNTKKMILLK